MADWLVHSLVQIGGTAALLAVAGIATGKWLWKKIDAALESYTNAYAQEAARIDARIGHLEKLAEEQARLTRTVEGIKDEISAQRKRHDNRWEFRKDVYVNLVSAITALTRVQNGLSICARMHSHLDGGTIVENAQRLVDQETVAVDNFAKYVNLAPLAVADYVQATLQHVKPQLGGIDIRHPDAERRYREAVAGLDTLLITLQQAARRDLWGTPEHKESIQAAQSG
jgi:hypothetical protein